MNMSDEWPVSSSVDDMIEAGWAKLNASAQIFNVYLERSRGIWTHHLWVGS